MSTAKGSNIPRFPLLLRGKRGTMYIAKRSDIHTGVPWSPLHLRGRHETDWFPLFLRGRRGIIFIAKGSDTRPGLPWSPLLLRGRGN